MKRLVVLFAVAVLAIGLLAAPAAAAPPAAPTGGPAGPSVYVGALTPAQLDTLFASGIDRSEVITAPGASGTVQVEIILSGPAAGALIAGGIPLAEKQTRRAAAGQRSASGNAVFRSYSEPGGIRDEYVATAAAHPDLVKLVVIGKTVQGQDIVAVKVTKDARHQRDGSRPAVLYASAQHAREWITPEMNRRLLHYFLDNYASDPQIHRLVDQTELWFVPVANPDGYDFTFTDGNRLWRKNLRDNDGDGVITGNDGVDLNRNFPTKWGYDNEGSSPSIANDTFRGTGPASEPETKAMDGLLRRIGFAFLVNYHSAAELLLYGVGWQVSTPTPDDLVYQALAGDDAHPAIPGYDPDISAELYTTNGDTDEHAHTAYHTLSFTPEMSTCQTASDADPDDAFNAADCESVFNFPDSEELVQAEFTKNIPFALAVAKSAKDPAHPVSPPGVQLRAPDFAVDSFDVSYGDPQTVAVTARRDIRDLNLWYAVNGGKPERASVREFRGGERYGENHDVYYGEFRGTVRDTTPGDTVEVWFTGSKRSNTGHSDDGEELMRGTDHRVGRQRVESEHFSYRVQQDGGSVLVLANEDYEGFNPGEPSAVTAPRYAQQYVDALAASGISAAVWDMSKQGVPHDLGVLGHFKAVVWYLGDNRLTQDEEDVITDFFPGTEQAFSTGDAAVAERQQFLTMAVRDYLNEGGKLAYTGETTGYYGVLGTTLGGIYYGLNGAPEQDCVVTDDPFSDCLLLADDFTQYYLGVYRRGTRGEPAGVTGTATPFAGTTFGLGGTASNPLNEAGVFTATSDVLPANEFPQFRSQVSSRYSGATPGPTDPLVGDSYAGAPHADDSYMRLARTFDLTAVPAADTPHLGFAVSYDTEPGFDNVIVEAHTVGQDDWTTLPESGGRTDSAAPDLCEEGFLIDEHPFLAHYLTRGDVDQGVPCGATGSTGAWNRMTGDSGGWVQVSFDLSAYAGRQVEVSISYVTDSNTGGAGVFVDEAALIVGGQVAESEGFENGPGVWSIPGAPVGSPPNTGDFKIGPPTVGASVTTRDTIMLGFGIEQIADPTERAMVLGDAVRYLGVRGRR